MKSRCLFFSLIVSLAVCAAAAEPEHPVVKPIDGFVPRPAAQQKVSNYNEFRFQRKDAQGRDELFFKKGKFWELDYHKPATGGDDDTSFSKIEIVDNYVAAVEEAGGTIMRKYGGELHRLGG